MIYCQNLKDFLYLLKKSVSKQFKIGASVRLRQYLWVVHGLAGMVVASVALEVQLKLFIVLLIILSLFYVLQQAARESNFTLRYSDDLGWEMAGVDKVDQSIKILPSTTLNNTLIFLHYQLEHAPRYKRIKTQLIACDSLSKTDFRQLKVALKISGLSS